MILTIFIFIVGLIAGMFGAASLIVGIRRTDSQVAAVGILLLILGATLVPNAYTLSVAIHGGPQ